jgi:hypothetical protein
MVEAAAEMQQWRRDCSTSIIATCSWREENGARPRRARGPLAAVLFVRSYDPLGGFFPPVARKLTQSP